MDDFHSGYRPGFRPYVAAGDRQLEIYSGRPSYLPPPPGMVVPTTSRRGKGSSSSTVKPWSFNDPEMQRRKRVAKYKVYAVEGKVKASFKKGLRWIKNRCSELVHGW